MDVREILEEHGALVGLGVLALVALGLWWVFVGGLDEELTRKRGALRRTMDRIDEYADMDPGELPVAERRNHLQEVKGALEEEVEAIRSYYEQLDAPLERWFDEQGVQDGVASQGYPQEGDFDVAYSDARDSLIRENEAVFTRYPAWPDAVMYQPVPLTDDQMNRALPELELQGQDSEAALRSAQKRFWIQRAIVRAVGEAGGLLEAISVPASPRVREAHPFVQDWVYSTTVHLRPGDIPRLVRALLEADLPFEVRGVQQQKDVTFGIDETTLYAYAGQTGNPLRGATVLDDFYVRTYDEGDAASRAAEQAEAIVPEPPVRVQIDGVVLDFLPEAFGGPAAAGGDERSGRDGDRRGRRGRGR